MSFFRRRRKNGAMEFIAFAQQLAQRQPEVLCYWPDQDCVCPKGDHIHHTLDDYERLEGPPA